jgi:hypothetical protein
MDALIGFDTDASIGAIVITGDERALPQADIRDGRSSAST